MSRCCAIACESVRLELPESSFMSGHPFAVIARLTMPPLRWRATYQGTAQPQAPRVFLADFFPHWRGVVGWCRDRVSFPGAPTGRCPPARYVEVVLACFE